MLEDLRGLQLVSPLIDPRAEGKIPFYDFTVGVLFTVYIKPKAADVHAVGLWQAAAGPVARQESVLQIDDCLAHFFISAQQIIVIDCNL